MGDKEYRAQKARVKKYVTKWVHLPPFEAWDITFVYDRVRSIHNPDTTGQCHANWEYAWATITFYMPSVADQTDDELEGVVVHELCHIPMCGMKFPGNEQARQIFERAVEEYSRLLLAARRRS